MHTFIKTIGIFSILIGSLSAGAQAADKSATQKYDANGITFEYPKTWKASTEKLEGLHQITVDSPESAILMITVTRKSGSETLAEFAKSFSSNAAAGLKTGKFEMAPIVKGSNKSEDMLTEKATLRMAGVSLPHSREYRLRSAGGRVAYLVTQVANEDSEKAAAGFALITNSFVMGSSK